MGQIVDAHNRADAQDHKIDDVEERMVRARALAACISHLPERARALLAWRYEESLQLNEIATRVHTSAEAVRLALWRLRASLQKCIIGQLKRNARQGAS